MNNISNMIANIMWLQLFAMINEGQSGSNGNINGTVSSGSTGTGTVNDALSPEMKAYYDNYIIKKTGPALIHDQFAEKVPIPQGKGKEVEFHEFASYEKATTPLQEGVTPLGHSIEVTSHFAKVEQYGDYTKVTDMLKMTAVDPMIVEVVEAHSDQAGRTLDTVTRNVLQGGTNVMYCPNVEAPDVEISSRTNLTRNSRLTVDMVMRVVAYMKANNVPKIDGKYIALIHPYAEYDLKRDPEWIDAHKYAEPTNLFDGEIGEVGGVRFVESSECKIYYGTDDDCPEGLAVFGTVFLGAKAYGTTEIEGGGLEVIIKPLGAGDDPLNQRSTVGWKATKTAERLIEDYIVRVESCSTRFSGSIDRAN